MRRIRIWAARLLRRVAGRLDPSCVTVSVVFGGGSAGTYSSFGSTLTLSTASSGGAGGPCPKLIEEHYL